MFVVRAWTVLRLRCSSAIAWCRRHRRLTGVIAVNFVLLTGILTWLLPSWVPRPIIRFEAPGGTAARLFPPRDELTLRLKTLGYYPLGAEPEQGILRGRKLNRYDYSLDASVPGAAIISLWTPLDRPDILATTTTVQCEPMLVITGGLMGDHAENVERKHADLAIRFFRNLAPSAYNQEGTPSFEDKESTVIRTQAQAEGLIMEKAGLLVKDPKKVNRPGDIALMKFVLRSSDW